MNPYADWFFSFLFCIILSVPLGVLALGAAPSPIPIVENRQLTPFPDLAKSPLEKWPALLDSSFKDQLAFRSQVVFAYIRIWESLLQAPVKRYITGKDGEVFLHYISPTVFPYLGVTPLSKEHLIYTKLSYAGMQAYFQLQGVPYFVYFFPDKTTLYPEYLPFWAHWKRGKSSYEQITETLKNCPINFFDFFDELYKHKKIYRLYDTRFDVEHWNGRSLAIAYNAIASCLTQVDAAFTPQPEGVHYALRMQESAFPGYPKEIVPFMEILHPDDLHDQHIFSPSNGRSNWDAPKLLINTTKTKLTLWLASDSYFLDSHVIANKNWNSCISPLAHHVQKYLHIHYSALQLPLCDTLTQTLRPDVVVEAFVERMGGNALRAMDPRIRILGDALLQTPGHILTPYMMQNQNIQAYNCDIYKADNMILLRTVNSNAPLLRLPAVVADIDGRIMLMARIVAPVDTVAFCFLIKGNQQELDERLSTKVSLKKGENLIHLQFLGQPGEQLRLAFVPGTAAGEYQFLPLPEVNQLRGESYGL